uniref:Uncharacterized protein n=1 Tax=Pristionchus pacificus TaxID=54126 RepID=A0A2A6CE38_PRIPA|eukprot:PDM76377.1 hypothetical protein PRIPAC_39981 [Pristionchus pacificus]
MNDAYLDCTLTIIKPAARVASNIAYSSGNILFKAASTIGYTHLLLEIFFGQVVNVLEGAIIIGIEQRQIYATGQFKID